VVTDVGRIGELGMAGDDLIMSARNKKKVYLYDTNGSKTATISVNSKGAPVDYFELAE